MFCPNFDLYCPKIVVYCPNFNLCVPTIQLNLLKKNVMYCPTISLNFVESLSRTFPISNSTVRNSSCYVRVVSSILVLYCPNFNLSIFTFQLNLLQNSSCTVRNFHLTLLNRYLVLSHIRIVMSENRLLLTYFQPVHTQNSKFSVKKVKYCPTVSPYFVELTFSTVPIST